MKKNPGARKKVGISSDWELEFESSIDGAVASCVSEQWERP
jgi:hypothetical protein